ncbi:MAG TPA: VCBS repeat-containing protein [Pyrinomonadaceae bacterium]|nr:VCBS repeat-containing protein [Pyrinomonadaceae bacterium]
MLALPAALSRPAGAQAPAACEAPMFKVFKDYISFSSGGSRPQWLTPADFNGDGLLDVAVANRGNTEHNLFAGSVSILLGDAASVFKQRVDLNAGRNPRAVLAGDFNRDGKADLAALTWGPVCCSDSLVSILLGNGDGTFKAPADFALGSNVSSMVVSDFNADGNTDVAARGASGLVVRLGDGVGGLYGVTFYATPGAPGALAPGDFNGDGRLDLATANPHGG